MNSKKSPSTISSKSQNHICPSRVFHKLHFKCKKLVRRADENANAQFKVGKNFINGENYFPKKIDLGEKYLTHSIKNGNCEALYYYCRLLIDGKSVEKNIEKALELLDDDEDQESSTNQLLRGLIFLQKK